MAQAFKGLIISSRLSAIACTSAWMGGLETARLSSTRPSSNPSRALVEARYDPVHRLDACADASPRLFECGPAQLAGSTSHKETVASMPGAGLPSLPSTFSALWRCAEPDAQTHR